MFHKTALPPERRSRDATAEGVLPRNLPPRLFLPQLRRLLLLSALAFVAVAFVSDAASPAVHVPCAPPDASPALSSSCLPSLGASPASCASPDGSPPFQYVMLSAGFLKLTRKRYKRHAPTRTAAETNVGAQRGLVAQPRHGKERAPEVLQARHRKLIRSRV